MLARAGQRDGRAEVIMRKIATALAALAGLTAGALLACEDKADTAEQQTQKKPAVADKAQKQNKAQKKKADQQRAEKTAVAKADKG
jgi:hypothetical protein